MPKPKPPGPRPIPTADSPHRTESWPRNRARGCPRPMSTAPSAATSPATAGGSARAATNAAPGSRRPGPPCGMAIKKGSTATTDATTKVILATTKQASLCQPRRVYRPVGARSGGEVNPGRAAACGGGTAGGGSSRLLRCSSSSLRPSRVPLFPGSCEGPATQHQQLRMPQGVRLQPGVGTGDQQICRRAGYQAGNARPVAGRPARGRRGRGTGEPGGAQCNDLTPDATVLDSPAGVAAGVNRDSRVDDSPDGVPEPGVQRPHVRGVTRVLGGAVGDRREGLDVDQCRYQGGPPRGHLGDGVRRQAGAVLDAVDAGGDQAGQRVGAEDVCGDPGSRVVRGGDRLGEHVIGPQGGEVTRRAVNPVTHPLDPAVPCRGLFAHSVGQQSRFIQLDADGRDDTLWPRQSPPGSDAACL